MRNNFLLTTALCTLFAMPLFASNNGMQAPSENPDKMVAYLFTYFNSNAPEDEQICYAISDDGYNFTPLNNGEPVISSDTNASVWLGKVPSKCSPNMQVGRSS